MCTITCQALLPLYHKDLVVCFMQKGVSLLVSNAGHRFLLVFWFDITHIQTKTHSTHRGQQTDTPIPVHINNNCYVLTTAFCITMNENLLKSKSYFTEFLNVFAFQKLLSCRSHIWWLDSTRLNSYHDRQLIQRDIVYINKTHTTHTEKGKIGNG